MGRGVLPIMAYTGRLCPRGVVLFQASIRYMKGLGNQSFRYVKCFKHTNLMTERCKKGAGIICQWKLYERGTFSAKNGI